MSEVNINRFGWPAEMLGNILRFLALDGAERTFVQLACLTHKNESLDEIVRKIEKPLVLTVNVPASGHRFLLPLIARLPLSVEIHWGDKCVEVVNIHQNQRPTHVYIQPALFTVRVFFVSSATPLDAQLQGDPFFIFGDTDYAGYPLSQDWHKHVQTLDTLGDIGIASLDYLFERTDSECVDITRLNVSRIASMEGMFISASYFNQPIGRWNVSNVRKMCRMFYSATRFNHPIGDWDVSNVTHMERMFYYAKAFNQPLASWKTGKVETMTEMFYDAVSFVQNINHWNVENVKHAGYIICGCNDFHSHPESDNMDLIKRLFH